MQNPWEACAALTIQNVGMHQNNGFNADQIHQKYNQKGEKTMQNTTLGGKRTHLGGRTGPNPPATA